MRRLCHFMNKLKQERYKPNQHRTAGRRFGPTTQITQRALNWDWRFMCPTCRCARSIRHCLLFRQKAGVGEKIVSSVNQQSHFFFLLNVSKKSTIRLDFKLFIILSFGRSHVVIYLDFILL